MTADKIKENVEDSLTESIKQKPHQAPIDKEVQESTEPLPEYEKYEQEERESELKTRIKLFSSDFQVLSCVALWITIRKI